MSEEGETEKHLFPTRRQRRETKRDEKLDKLRGVFERPEDLDDVLAGSRPMGEFLVTRTVDEEETNGKHKCTWSIVGVPKECEFVHKHSKDQTVYSFILKTQADLQNAKIHSKLDKAKDDYWKLRRKVEEYSELSRPVEPSELKTLLDPEALNEMYKQEGGSGGSRLCRPGEGRGRRSRRGGRAGDSIPRSSHPQPEPMSAHPFPTPPQTDYGPGGVAPPSYREPVPPVHPAAASSSSGIRAGAPGVPGPSAPRSGPSPAYAPDYPSYTPSAAARAFPPPSSSFTERFPPPQQQRAPPGQGDFGSPPGFFQDSSIPAGGPTERGGVGGAAAAAAEIGFGRNMGRGSFLEGTAGARENIQGTECDEVLLAREGNSGRGGSLTGVSQEISFAPGQLIRVTWKHPSGWWYGSVEGPGGPYGTSPVGWFPAYKVAP
uniref:SH3 domain-containing protein n=1 Tax=Chromera velia CCMP2878 TaxID=1169474 RepID=A0A0G4G5F9_9ALVE|eukprot:Cvel_20350.t1-p1 / transcript=Cvel_20350.t1 / gene=Cvel_20350 / organism=Chromera_velia_CCMP2878 / gene_product=hypothetical protein / transcript_product=hypothetical protein / location=Cvel_scaffold1819:36425-37717(-) / protein_length=431 / sequence_SO=supercontig / SO=protein_coding / is_pseudo=false